MGHLASFFRVATVLPAAVLSAACFGDGGNEDLQGTVSLASGVRASDFATLQIRVYADPGGPFDPSKIPSDAVSDEMPTSTRFPYAYDLPNAGPPSDGSTWRMVTWLSRSGTTNATGQVVPAKGDVLCTAVGTLPSCGTYGGYCGKASGVDCTLASALP
jgi:hypothetical protein